MSNDYSNVLTMEASDKLRNEMLESMHTRLFDSGREENERTKREFITVLERHLLGHRDKVTLALVPPEEHTKPQDYEYVRLATVMWTFGQTGAQLAKEVQQIVDKMQVPCIVGGLGMELIGGTMIFIVLYVKRPCDDLWKSKWGLEFKPFHS